jgi:hypothetical protein
MRFLHLAHRSAAAHKLHSPPLQDETNLISGNDQTSSRLPAFSLFLPESCPNNRDRRSLVRFLASDFHIVEANFVNGASAENHCGLYFIGNRFYGYTEPDY